jgi:hypothetical protein
VAIVFASPKCYKRREFRLLTSMRPRISLIFELPLSISFAARAQDSLCDIFKDLKAADGRQVSIRGELFLTDNLAALGATACDSSYTAPIVGETGPRYRWPTAIELRSSQTLPPAQILELKNRSAQVKKIGSEGNTVAAYGTFSGRLTLGADRNMPATLTFDDARDITVEALPPVSELPVIPICDLFQDLPKCKGQRIAVRAEIVGTMEGTWLSGSVKENYAKDAYHAS